MILDIKPDSPNNRFRLKRILILNKLIEKVLDRKGRCSVLDLGGTYNFWVTWKKHIDWSRTNVTCVNMNPEHFSHGKEETSIRMIKGNACDLRDIETNEHDIAFSNSVIEHVGPWQSMQAMAEETRRVAPFYMVQTPYFWFPIEPHARTPMLHWLPESLSYRIVMSRKCGYWSKQQTVSGAVRTVQSAHLLDLRQFKELFSDGIIYKEKFALLTKSMTAIRGLEKSEIE